MRLKGSGETQSAQPGVVQSRPLHDAVVFEVAMKTQDEVYLSALSDADSILALYLGPLTAVRKGIEALRLERLKAIEARKKP